MSILPSTKTADGLQARQIETPLGGMLALASQDGLHLLEFVDRRELEDEMAALRSRLNCNIEPGTNLHLEQLSRELQSYFEGRELTFSVPLVVGGSAFERQVWAKLQMIPPGEMWSYTELAERVGNRRAVRAVGRANGRNCMAIVIPCHRVIRSDGNLCGYGGGIHRKQWLLEHERQVIGQPASSNRQLMFDLSVTA